MQKEEKDLIVEGKKKKKKFEMKWKILGVKKE